MQLPHGDEERKTSFSVQPAAARRFARDLERIAPESGALGLAVSGGPDSLALLLLAVAALPGRVAAATVDHQLRPGSAAEALEVEHICERLGCPHTILTVDVRGGGNGVQGEARRARYAAMAGWARRAGVDALATGHHQEDQAETLLMRAARGAGVGGLGAIRPLRMEGDLRIVRPLLGWSKAELVRLVADAGIAPAEDPSNHDPRFDRTRFRRLLRDHPELEPARLARSASACREADEALDWAAAGLIAERVRSASGECTVDASGLPREFKRRLLAHAVAQLRGALGLADLPSIDLEGLLSALEDGATVTRAGLLARGGMLWRLTAEPPRRATKSG